MQIPRLGLLSDNMRVIEPHRCLGYVECRKIHYELQIQVRHKLIPVLLHCSDFLTQSHFLDAKLTEQTRFEIRRLRDNLAPMMLSIFLIREEFAPFEHANVEAIAIRNPPEIHPGMSRVE